MGLFEREGDESYDFLSRGKKLKKGVSLWRWHLKNLGLEREHSNRGAGECSPVGCFNGTAHVFGTVCIKKTTKKIKESDDVVKSRDKNVIILSKKLIYQS